VPDIDAARDAGAIRRPILPLLVMMALAAIVVAAAPSFLGTYLVNMLIRALLLAALALTVDILWGYAGILTFGQSAFFGIGAYACALIFSHKGSGADWAIVALLIGVATAAAVALLVGWLAFYHGASPLYSSIITLALPIVLVQVIFSGGRFTGSSSGLSGYLTYYWPLDVWFWIAGGFLIAVTALGWLFVRSDFGNLLVAIRENEDRCAYLGVPVSGVKIGLMVACAAIAAMAGFGYAAFSDVVAPELAGFLLGTELLIWVALGGRGTLLGPVFGAIAIDVTTSYLSGSLPFLWKLLVGVTFVVVIIVLPNGFAPVFGRLWRGAMEIISKRKDYPSGPLPVPVKYIHPAASLEVAAPPLRIGQLTRRYGSLKVLDRVDVEGRAGELASIVGPNGAGKTTLMRCISDGTERSSGNVEINGVEIRRASPQKIVALGVGRSFQNTNLFDTLTVVNCLMLARYHRDGASWLGTRRTINLPQPTLDVMAATGLDAMLNEASGSLSHGMKRALELAMVLATEPNVLLLDEPTAGLTKSERTAIGQVLSHLARDYGLCVFLIEHDLDFVREISDRIVVLHQGRMLMDGTVEEVVSSELVRSVYAGHVMEAAS
jgi:branched-chain amino acid transport system permease protein